MSQLVLEDLTGEIIGAAIEVHRELGPGLMESAYQACLYHELSSRKVPCQQKVKLPVCYKGKEIDCKYELDLLVDRRVVVELKATKEMHPVFEAQLLTYMKLSRCRVGLLINFHVPVLKQGIRRFVL